VIGAKTERWIGTLQRTNPRGRAHEEELVKGKASAVIVELK
jgi:hypothetical protein